MSVILFILALSVLVLIHEAGHFLAARLFGVKADEFGIGFPPRIVGFVRTGSGWKKVSRTDRSVYKNTIWSFNWLPLGGFVRIKGEEASGIADADSIHTKPIWQRIVIIVAGVAMNWLMAIILFTIVFVIGVTMPLEDVPAGMTPGPVSITITNILAGSPAENAGLEIGDQVIAVNGQSVTGALVLRQHIQQQQMAEFDLTVQRGAETKETHLAPVELAELQRPGIGVAFVDMVNVSYPLPQAFIQGIATTAELTVAIFQAFGDMLKRLFVQHELSPDISGPVGIAVITSKIAKQGIVPLIQFVAILSINLAVINVLPIPALDGGRALFLLIEKIRRKPMNRMLEIKIHNIAFLVLILLIVLVTVHDVSRLRG